MAYWTSLVVVILVAVTSSNGQEANFTHRAYLDAAENYFLQWRYDTDTITFRVEVATLGYVGFGISPNGDMTGADIVTGFVTDQGETFFYDRYATSRYMPTIDASQDWTLEASGENDTHTFLQFSRKLVLCDDKDRTIKAETNRVIWSYHENDPPRDTELMYHGETRGARSLMLLSVAENKNLPEDVQSIEFRHDAYAVPDNRSTTYLCRGFRIPDLGGKMHIVSTEPVIQAGNEGVVHHILLHMCSQEPDPDRYHGHQHICRKSNMPDDLITCRVIMIGWAVGGEGFYYPDNVGQSFGGPDDPRFVLLEIHYDNPQLKSGIVDSSGLRLWYTSALREHDLGRLELGVEVSRNHIIPPRSSAFVTIGTCYPDCLQKAMEKESVEKIHVFGVLLHSHLAGRKMRIRHVRNGVELPWLAKDDNYDFNYQQTTRLEREVEVLPAQSLKSGFPRGWTAVGTDLTNKPRGDHLIMECTYDTTDRHSITYGGESTRREMCLGWILFYPRMKLVLCKSGPYVGSYLTALGATGYTLSFEKGAVVPTGPPWMAGKSLWSILPHLCWDEAMRQTFQALERTANRATICLNDDSSEFHYYLQWLTVQDAPPLITQPFEDADVCNGPPTTTEDTPHATSSYDNVLGTPSVTNLPYPASSRSNVSSTPPHGNAPRFTCYYSNFFWHLPWWNGFFSINGTVENITSSGVNGSFSINGTVENMPSSGVTNSPSSGVTNIPSSGVTNIPSSGVTNIPSSGVTNSPSSGLTNSPSLAAAIVMMMMMIVFMSIV